MTDFVLPPGDYLPGNYRPLKLVVPHLEGWDVYSIQTGLAYVGADPGKIDGDFGKRTQDAVDMFQRSHNLEADAVCGGLTMASICSVAARKLNRVYKLPKGIPYGHFEHESSLLPPNFTKVYPANGSRDCGVVQENTRWYSLRHAFNVEAAGEQLCGRIIEYHDKYRAWGVDDPLAWRLACGSWNAPAWTDEIASGEPIAPEYKALILAYIEAVTTYSDL